MHSLAQVEHNYFMAQMMTMIADSDDYYYEYGMASIAMGEDITTMPCTDDIIQDAEYCSRKLNNNLEEAFMMVKLGRLEGEDDYKLKGER